MSLIALEPYNPLVIFECQDSHLTALAAVLRTIEEQKQAQGDVLIGDPYSELLDKVQSETLAAISAVLSTYTNRNCINMEPKTK